MVFVAILCASVSKTLALDTTIKILVIATSDANTQYIQTQVNRLSSAWGASNINSFVLLEWIDGGIPSQLSGGPLLANEATAQIAEAMAPTRNLLSLRVQKGADIVLLYTSDLENNFGNQICGKAPQQYWFSLDPGGGQYVAGEHGLDRRGWDTDFVAIMATSSPNCSWSDLTAHEFGHLLGAGHQRYSAAPFMNNSGAYIRDDSHAKVDIDPPAPPGEDPPPIKTIVSQGDNRIQECIDYGHCVRVGKFSSSEDVGDDNHENSEALQLTAFSVANYLETQTCGLTVPEDVYGHVVQACIPKLGLTQHQIYWSDDCPDESDYYEIHRSFISPVGPYSFGWTASVTTSPIFNNVPGWAKVNACKSSSCTTLSESFYFAPALCTPL